MLPLALAQFVASYAGSNMNVAISSIATDLGTSVTGIQTTITLFTLTMAALMIPGSKLTDIWGRRFCFLLGLVIYGAGALLASVAQGLPLLMIGYSLLEGVGSALLIPPIYILITMLFDDTTTRAKYFGVVSGAAGIGAAAGPLIGGLVTSYISWRASFLLQVLIVAAIIWLGRGIADPPLPAQRPAFDWLGAVLSALGLFFVVFGVLQSGVYGWGTATQDYAIGDTVIIHQGGISPVWLYVGIGVVVLALFIGSAWAREKNGRAPLVSVKLFANLASNLGLLTQNLPMAGPAGLLLRDLGVPPAGPRLLGDRDRAGAAARHDRPAAVVRGRPTHGPQAQPAPADPVRLLRHRPRTRPAARARRYESQRLELPPWPVPHGRRGRDHAHRVGQPRAVGVAGKRPGRHFRRVAQRLQPGLLARCGDRRLPGRRRHTRRRPVLLRARDRRLLCDRRLVRGFAHPPERSRDKAQRA